MAQSLFNEMGKKPDNMDVVDDNADNDASNEAEITIDDRNNDISLSNLVNTNTSITNDSSNGSSGSNATFNFQNCNVTINNYK